MKVHSQVANMLKQNQLSNADKKMVYKAYQLLIRDCIKLDIRNESLEAENRELKSKCKELQEIIRESKILN